MRTMRYFADGIDHIEWNHGPARLIANHLFVNDLFGGNDHAPGGASQFEVFDDDAVNLGIAILVTPGYMKHSDIGLSCRDQADGFLAPWIFDHFAGTMGQRVRTQHRA